MAVTSEHRVILAADIEAFGDPARTNPVRVRLHRHVVRLLSGLLAQAGVAPEQYASSDTGDGLVVSVAAEVPAEHLLDPLIPRMARRLVNLNRRKPQSEDPRLRVALHAGRVLADPQPLHVVYERLGRYGEALECHQATLTIRKDLGDRHGEARALRDLGDVLRAVGRGAEAQAAWRQALLLCKELGLPEADEIGSRLASRPPETPCSAGAE